MIKSKLIWLGRAVLAHLVMVPHYTLALIMFTCFVFIGALEYSYNFLNIVGGKIEKPFVALHNKICNPGDEL